MKTEKRKKKEKKTGEEKNLRYNSGNRFKCIITQMMEMDKTLQNMTM